MASYEYAYADHHQDELLVRPSVEGGNLAYVSSNGMGVLIPPGELPSLVAALYRATGQQPPILLSRPDGPDDEENILKWWVEGDRVVAHVPQDGYLTPGVAREYAVNYAIAADLAENVPAAQQVAAMAQVIDGITNGVGPNLGERIARELVAAGWRREAAADA